MWSYENGKIKLDISKIRDDFKITSENGLHLIHPRKNFLHWFEREKWLRSIVIDNDGFVVSCSWKKFGNYGEFVEDTRILDRELREGHEVIYTEKMDGSLCIRYVYNNEVIFRTRGTLFGGHDSEEQIAFGERFKKIACEKYPILLDKNFASDRSLLFEYISPSNIIVIRYNIDDLIFLGWVLHKDLSIGKWKDIKVFSEKHGLSLVKIHNLPKEPLKLIETIQAWKDEGIVARFMNNQSFIKVKSAFYLLNHRMKSSMNYLSIVEFVEKEKIENEKQLVDKLDSCSYDWEIIESAKEFYNKYLIANKLKDDILIMAKTIVNDFNKNWISPPGKKNWQYKKEEERIKKKEFALLLDKIETTFPKCFLKPIAFGIFDNKEEKINKLCRKIILTDE